MTLYRVGEPLDQVAPHLRRALAHDWEGEGASLNDITRGARLVSVLGDDGAPIAALSLQLEEHDEGRALHCLAAGGEPGHQLVPAIDRVLMSEARRLGARWITFETCRPGLVRQSERLGWTRAAVVMRKAVTHG